MTTAARAPRRPRRPRASGRDRQEPRPARGASARRRRRLLGAALAVTVLLVVYFAWIRDLPAFRVKGVSVHGAGAAYAPELRTDLRRAARDMTTLHVRENELRAVGRRYRAVVSLAVHARLPDRLSVTVLERPPVAVVSGPGETRVPVAADGTTLAGESLGRPLPQLAGRVGARARRAPAETAAAARLAAAAPPALAAGVAEISRGGEGWMVSLRHGPRVRFGTLSELEAKWSAAAAVLAAPAARGAGYVDVRLPDRPAAGEFPPTRPSAGASQNSPPQVKTLGQH